jgi:hypothetical protein
MPSTSFPSIHQSPVIRGEARTIIFRNITPQHFAFQIKSGDLYYYTPDSTHHNQRWFHALIVAAQNYVEFNTAGTMSITITIRVLLQWSASRLPPQRQTSPLLKIFRDDEIQRHQSLPQSPYPWNLVDQTIPRSQWETDIENRSEGGFRDLWASVQSLVYRLLWRSEQRTSENQGNQTV